MKKAIALLAWVTLLMSIPTVLYYFHVSDQGRDVLENNLRTLSKAAETTNGIFQRSIENVRNLDPTSEFVCDFHDRQPYLEWGSDDACKTSSDYANRRVENVTLSADDSGFEIQGVANTEKDEETNRLTYIYDVQLDPLLGDIPFSDTLELLFIVDAQGEVVHQHRPEGQPDAGLVIRSLDAFQQGVGGDYNADKALRKASRLNTLRVAGAKYELLCQPLALPLSPTLPPNADNDTDNDADDDADDESVDGNWLLCGLVDSDRALRQSLLVAPFLAFTLFTVTVFGFLTWPAIKLHWMSVRDRLYFADLVFLLFGTWGGLMLATILILGFGSYSILNQKSESTLKQLAVQIEANLQEEIDGLAKSLYDFDRILAKSFEFAEGFQPEDSQKPGIPYRLVQENDPAYTLEDIDHVYSDAPSELKKRDEPQTKLANAYFRSVIPEFESALETKVVPINSDIKMAFWAGPNGQQGFKVTPYERNTRRVDVGHREYFKAARGNRLWSDPASMESVKIPRFVEPIRSVTTSNFTTVVSICSQISMAGASKSDASPKKGCPVVAGIETVLISTSKKAVLPPDTGFAIIDAAGDVKLHSDERRALFENLYEEMDDGDRLKSVVLARSPQDFKTRYLGRSRQVFVKPLDGTPWSIVTFSDTEMISTAIIEIVAHAAILALIFLFFYAFLTFCFFLLRGPEIPLWFWPGSSSRQVAQWRYLTAFFALLLVPMMVTVNAEYMLLAAAGVPLLVFIGTYFTYRQISRREGTDNNPGDVSPSQVRSSTNSSFAICIVAALLPAGVFFSDALNNQNRLLVRYENEHLAQQIVDRNCAINDYYRSVDDSKICSEKSDGCLRIKRRLPAAGDLYPSAMFWPAESASDEKKALPVPKRPVKLPEKSTGCAESSDAQDTFSANIWAVLARFKPIYNPTALQSRYLSPTDEQGRANNTCWSLQPPSKERSTWAFRANHHACSTNIELKSGSPLQKTVYLQRPVLLLVALLLIVIYYWMRYAVRRIFFGCLRMPPLRGRTGKDGLENTLLEKENNSSCRLIVTAASQLDRAELLRPSVDKESPGDQHPSTTHGQFTRYDMTDYHKGEVRRAEMLSNLENDVIAGKNILIVSPVDPFRLMIPDDSPTTIDESDSASKLEAQQEAENLHRWRQVLSQFRVVILSFNSSQPWSMSTSIWQRGLDKAVDEKWLRDEFEAVPELNKAYSLIGDGLKGSSRRNALDRIGERAFGYYMALWDACSEEEKLVLVQLTFENVVNPKQARIVRRLLQRGFLMRDPELRIMNQSFARFIAQVQDPSQVREWEDHGLGVSWVHTRWVLLGVLLLGLLFLLVTQRELFNTTVMFLSAGAVGIPGLMKMVANLGRFGGTGSK